MIHELKVGSKISDQDNETMEILEIKVDLSFNFDDRIEHNYKPLKKTLAGCCLLKYVGIRSGVRAYQFMDVLTRREL